MDERLRGRWLSVKFKNSEKGWERGKILIIKVISRYSVIVSARVKSKWSAPKAMRIDNNRIMDDENIIFYILDIQENSLLLFNEINMSLFQMERMPDID
jgi:hypothetical protein